MANERRRRGRSITAFMWFSRDRGARPARTARITDRFKVEVIELPSVPSPRPVFELAATSHPSSARSLALANSPAELATRSSGGLTPTVAAAREPGAPARPWHRRPRLVIPLALALAILSIAGLIGFQFQQTIATINEVSTPANTISGSALGGDEAVTIDTGPAKSAVAGAAPARASTTPTAMSTATTSGQLPPPPISTAETEDETGDDDASDAEASATEVSAGSDNAGDEPAASEPSPEPAATEDRSTPATTSEPEPTATPRVVLSEIERITNGGFEDGDNGWYLENGAAPAETEAVNGSRALVMPANNSWADQAIYFLPGTTYQLTVWGRIGVEGDRAEIGISYTDQYGERMETLEPATLRFTRTTYVKRTLRFTAPEGVETVRVFIWKPAGAGSFFVDQVSVRSEARPAEFEPAESPVDDDAITILMMGVDARPGEAIDIGVRPDSLMVLRLNPDTGSCRILAIPRDTRTDLQGYGLSKVNHALAVGGIPYQQQTVEALLGLTIDHYVLVDFAGFQELVDAVGGISIDVEDPFAVDQDIWFAAGQQTLDGKLALAYARYRGGADGDFGRIARQQQVLRALVKRASRLNVVRSLNELLPAAGDHIRTDLSPSEMARIGLDYRDTCTDESLDMLRLEGFDAWFDDPLLQMRLQYIVVDEAEIQSKVALLVEG